MRNLFLIDDAKGTLMATQGVGGMAATLIEGQNIEAARLTLRNDEYGNPVRSLGAQPAGSQTTIDDNAARSSAATVTAPNMAAKTPVTVVMPQPGDDQDAAMYAARVARVAAGTYIDGEITVPGSFLDNGDLWINHVGDLVSIQSPMLVPAAISRWRSRASFIARTASTAHKPWSRFATPARSVRSAKCNRLAARRQARSRPRRSGRRSRADEALRSN